MIHIKVETNKSSSDNMEMYLAKGSDTFQRFAAHISEAGYETKRGRKRERLSDQVKCVKAASVCHCRQFRVQPRVDISIPMFH